MDAAHRQQAEKLVEGGVKYLLANRDADGGWSMMGGANKPALTAMAVKVLLQDPRYGRGSAEVRQGLKVMLSFRQADGGIYDPRMGYQNYTTSLAVTTMAAANDPQLNEAMRQAVEYLRSQQIVPGSESPDGSKIGRDSAFVGGVSYGKHGRPDLSNVGMWMQAMHDAGVKGDDPAMQRALVFLTRVQNCSESNDMAWAKEGSNDGGFVYAPARAGKAGGESPAGEGEAGQGLRSYGSMTYTGFKSMLYADLKRDDPRVTAAMEWIGRYWRLDSNPNMPQSTSKQGLFYYYYVFSKAMQAWGEPVITDVSGRQHNWRQELIEALAERVGGDGSWVNNASRWEEGDAKLVTCYCVLALQETLRK